MLIVLENSIDFWRLFSEKKEYSIKYHKKVATKRKRKRKK
jgi:hypothetical protein